MHERCTGRNIRARACNMHSQEPNRGEPQVLLGHMALMPAGSKARAVNVRLQ